MAVSIGPRGKLRIRGQIDLAPAGGADGDAFEIPGTFGGAGGRQIQDSGKPRHRQRTSDESKCNGSRFFHSCPSRNELIKRCFRVT